MKKIQLYQTGKDHSHPRGHVLVGLKAATSTESVKAQTRPSPIILIIFSYPPNLY